MKRSLLLLAAFGSGWCVSEILYAQQELPPPVPAPVVAAARDNQFEPLTRGPVHEAFAQGVTSTTNEGLTVKKEPPPLIDEIPPAQRPAGDDVAWIPGYWGWDDERDDFIWISGIWRAIPPGRQWMPGYWARVQDGHQWIAGYWADTSATDLEYLPPPPETVDAGPTTQSPTGNEIWIPGCWVWQQNKYLWRPGYWAKGDARWVWTNSHYIYTPRGYVYVTGYWDFLPQQRGVLFAPVYFSAPVARNYVYSPRTVVSTTLLLDNLFLRPNYGHYYYGDYYAAPYQTRGILPYYVFNDNRRGYDSIYAWQRWHHRNDRDWDRTIAARYDQLRDREDGRPPRDWATWERRNRDADRNPFFSGIQDYSRSAGSTWKFRDLGDDHRRDVGRMSRDLDTYRQQRVKAEAEATARTGDDRGPDRIRLLKPPIGDQTTPRPGRTDRDGVPGRDVLPGRDNVPGRDVLPGRDNVPGRDVLPGRDDRDDRPRLDRGPRETPPVDPRDRLPGTPNDTPRVKPSTPRPETPRVETPKVDRPKADPRPRPERPQVDTPKPDRPKLDPPKATPMPMPRPEPRPETKPEPRPQPSPRVDRPERPAPGPGAGPGRPQGGGDRPNRGKKD